MNSRRPSYSQTTADEREAAAANETSFEADWQEGSHRRVLKDSPLAHALRCVALPLLRKPSNVSLSQLTTRTEASSSSSFEEEGEPEGDVEEGCCSSLEMDAVAVKEAQAAAVAAVEAVVVMDDPLSWGQRLRRALRPRRLREKALSFCVGVVHGVAGVSSRVYVVGYMYV